MPRNSGRRSVWAGGWHQRASSAGISSGTSCSAGARRVPDPKIVLGDFNEWGRGLVADVLAEAFSSVDLYPHLKRRRTYPGFFPVLHLDHIYFSGNIEIRRVELPRTR